MYGAIAAANAISDIYAMGASPLFALSFVGFPDRELPIGVLEQILKGAHDKAAEAGIEIAGGHTIEDSEPKFGLAVTGVVDPRKILRNSTAKPGDALILTKPLGTGIVMTALKKKLAQIHEATEAMTIMAELNRRAAEVIARYPVNACTDITGFGLMGHLKEMVVASGVSVVLQSASIPVLASSLKYARGESISGGTRNNREHTNPFVEYGPQIPEKLRWVLCDAQTSGGLLISLPAQEAERCRSEMVSRGLTNVAVIGMVVDGKGTIRVV
jgi:selenide,water dikinase